MIGSRSGVGVVIRLVVVVGGMLEGGGLGCCSRSSRCISSSWKCWSRSRFKKRGSSWKISCTRIKRNGRRWSSRKGGGSRRRWRCRRPNAKAQYSLLYKPDLSESDDGDVFWKKIPCHPICRLFSAFIVPAESVLTSLESGSSGDASPQESPSGETPSVRDGVSPCACLT